MVENSSSQRPGYRGEGHDNLPYGSIVSVHVGHDAYITALTDGGIEELRDMLVSARVSIEEWRSFLEDFVAEPDIIARIKDQPLR
ncbi:hypothetical protein AB9K41_30500 [Cribrihabitans sp. XS_ASV171]